MECCGYDRHTPYCPMCGKFLAKGPIEGILEQCRRNYLNYEKMIKRRIEFHGEKEREEPQCKNDIRLAEKWKARYKALKELIEKNKQ